MNKWWLLCSRHTINKSSFPNKCTASVNQISGFMICLNFSFSKLNRLQETRPWVYSECGINEYISSGLVWDEWISAQASSQSNRYQFSSVCIVVLDLPEQITAELLLPSLNLETFIMLRESVCCTIVPLAAGASWKPYNNTKPPQCWLEAPAHYRGLWGQSIGHNKEIPFVYGHPLCSAFTSVWAVLAMSDWSWFYTCTCAKWN